MRVAAARERGRGVWRALSMIVQQRKSGPSVLQRISNRKPSRKGRSLDYLRLEILSETLLIISFINVIKVYFSILI